MTTTSGSVAPGSRSSTTERDSACVSYSRVVVTSPCGSMRTEKSEVPQGNEFVSTVLYPCEYVDHAFVAAPCLVSALATVFVSRPKASK